MAINTLQPPSFFSCLLTSPHFPPQPLKARASIRQGLLTWGFSNRSNSLPLPVLIFSLRLSCGFFLIGRGGFLLQLFLPFLSVSSEIQLCAGDLPNLFSHSSRRFPHFVLPENLTFRPFGKDRLFHCGFPMEISGSS